MKVVFLKNNNFNEYKFKNLEGYLFNPKNKNVKFLKVIKKDYIKYILFKRINRDIFKLKNTIKIIVNSEAAIIEDCKMMIDEVLRLTIKIEKNYKEYFNEFQYFELIKELYLLYNVITYKNKTFK